MFAIFAIALLNLSLTAYCKGFSTGFRNAIRVYSALGGLTYEEMHMIASISSRQITVILRLMIDPFIKNKPTIDVTGHQPRPNPKASASSDHSIAFVLLMAGKIALYNN